MKTQIPTVKITTLAIIIIALVVGFNAGKQWGAVNALSDKSGLQQAGFLTDKEPLPTFIDATQQGVY
jgi:hypothetical protein